MIYTLRNPSLELAFFTALAVAVYVLESFLPKPLPFLRIGLANVVVLVVLVTRGFSPALVVTLGKTLVGGLFSGLLLSPTTLLSLCSSLTALGVMFLILQTGLGFSLIGISIAGATIHNLVQLVLIRSILIREDSIFYLIPVMIILGIITGIITGFLAEGARRTLIEKG